MNSNSDPNSGVKLSGKQTKCPKCGYIFFSDDHQENNELIDTSERRAHKRIKKQSIVRLNGKMALLTDISEGGMLLGSYERPADPEVNIEIKIQENSFKLNGMVKWMKEKDSFSGLNSIGIMLKDPPEKFRKLIKNIAEQE